MYQDFIEYYEAHGYEFPCTQLEFIARAMEFSKAHFMNSPTETSEFENYEAMADALCCQGIGSNWRQ